MKGFNRVTLIGNLTKDPEKSSASAPVRFNLAVNKSYKNRNGETVQTCDFIPCAVWGKLGDEIVMRYCHKGDAILAEGELRVQSFDDTKTGTKKWSTDVFVSNVVLLGGKRDNGSTSTLPANDAVRADQHAVAEAAVAYDESNVPTWEEVPLFEPDGSTGRSAEYQSRFGTPEADIPF